MSVDCEIAAVFVCVAYPFIQLIPFDIVCARRFITYKSPV